MESLLRKAGVVLGKYWVAVFAIMIVITVVLGGLGLRGLEFATGQDSYLEPDSQAAIDNVQYQEAFGGETLIVLFQAQEGKDITDLFSDANRKELERLETGLRNIDSVYTVVAPLTTLEYSEKLVNEVGTQALLSAAERDPSPEGQAIRQADIQVSLARLTAAGEKDFTNPDWREFLLFGNPGFSVEDDGALVPPPDEERVVRASLKSTYPETNVAVGGVLLTPNADLDTLSSGTEQVVDLMKTAELEGFDVLTTGSPVFLGEINDYLQGGMLTLGAAAMGVMALVLLVMFKVRWRLLPLLAVLFGVIWGFSVVGLVGLDLSLVTISGLPILIGLGIDFAIQIHNRVEEEVVLDRAKHPMSETLARLAPPLATATMAAILAFTALQISRVPMIRDFGVLLMIGILALLIVGIIIPIAALGAREYKAKTTERDESRVEKLVVKLGSLSPKTAVPLIIGSVVLFVAGIALEGSFEIQSDPVEWVNQESQVVEDLDTLEEATGFSSTLGILVEANDVLDQDLNEVVFEFTEDATKNDLIAATSSVVNTMAKIIEVPGATPIAPDNESVRAAADLLPDDLRKALISPDGTATQINLRLADSSLDERADLVAELQADLNGRLDALQVPDDSPLKVELADGQPAVRAIPAGLAIVGVSLLENLSANRALLTYMGIAIVGLWLMLRYRSITRTGLSLLPVGLAVGASSALIAALDVSLSPLTTVSGPLVVATCTEFSILIVARYLEERNRGLEPPDASKQAAGRTGRAFFTSAATTIGGFAVLIGSALPLLRDFGIIVTINVAVALFAALVVMPPVLVWADGRGLLASQIDSSAAHTEPPAEGARTRQLIGVAVGIILLGGTIVAMWSRTDTSTAAADDYSYTEVAPPTTTTTAPPANGENGEVDPSTFGTEKPAGTVAGLLFDKLTAQGVEPQVAVCTAETLLDRMPEGELLAAGLPDAIAANDRDNEALQAVIAAGQDCGVDDATIDATIEAGL